MRKTLILVVDRDDDFGAKGGVETPCIGIEACKAAATALGIADPEDSDTNALYAAMNIYRDFEATEEPGSFEVALVCGNQKVGYLSDRAVAMELDRVFDTVRPDAAILVGDGAEDEYVYPIVASRVPIDGVRKVYVKQAPGVEGTYYILAKTLEDPQKRERFVAPVGWLVTAISSVYLLSAYLLNGYSSEFLGESVTPILFLALGLLLVAYGYDVNDRTRRTWHRWSERAKEGSVTVLFLVASAIFILFGLAMGVYYQKEYYTEGLGEQALVFVYYFWWFGVFAVLVYLTGALVDRYLNDRVVKFTIITNIVDVIGAGLMVTGFFEWSGAASGVLDADPTTVTAEIFVGLLLMVFSHVNNARVARSGRSGRGGRGLRRVEADLRGDMRRHGLRPGRRRVRRASPRLSHAHVRPRRRGRRRGAHEGRGDRLRRGGVPRRGHRVEQARRDAHLRRIRLLRPARHGHPPRHPGNRPRRRH